MFLPFLPLILASLSLSLLTEDTAIRPEAWLNLPWPLTLLILLGLAFWLGQASFEGRPLTRQRQQHLKRLLIFSAWLGAIYTEALDLRLQGTFQGWWNPDGWAFALLIVHFWLLDGLALTPLQHRHEAYAPRLIRSLRLQLPLLLLGGVHALWLAALPLWTGDLPLNWELLLSTLSSLVLMIALAPPVMMTAWNLEALPESEGRTLIEEELRVNGVSVRKVLIWPEELLSSATAGVVGLLPGLRYLLISRQLLNALTPEELRAVIAHEAGHLRKQHLLFYAFAFFAFLEGMMLLSAALTVTEWFGEWELPAVFYGSFTVLALLLFLRFGMGFLSRNFERQADCNALERVGLEPMGRALLKVAWLNGIDPEKPNWHHYGILDRLNFLKAGAQAPEKVSAHHRRVRWIQFGCVLTLLCTIGINSYATSNAGIRQWLTWYVQHNESLSPRDSGFLTQLGDLAYSQGQLEEAERYYRQALELAPEDPRTLNNLAWVLAENRADDPEALEESIQLAQTALAHQPAAFIWDTLAEGYRQQGLYEQALHAAQEALRLADQSPRAQAPSGSDYYENRLTEIRNAR